MPNSVKLKEEIRKHLPVLLEKDEKFRKEVSFILSESLARRDELGKILEEMRLSREESNKRFEQMDRRFEQMDKRFEQMDKRLEQMREESNKRFEAVDRRFEAVDRRFEALILEMRTGFQTIDRRLSSIGQRWGIQTEEAVRQFAMEFIASEFGVQAIEWRHKDAQLDLIIKDGEHFVIEVKSTLNTQEVERFVKNVSAYCEQTGVAPKRKIIVTAHGTSAAYKQAQASGVEIISG